MSSLEVVFVAAHGTVWSGQAAQVVVPAVDGSMGILPRMQPTLAVLRRGPVRIIAEDGSVTEVQVDGGFVSMDENVVTIGVDDVEMDRSSADAARL
ncbi:F0F1 ATP synthase subunit epsilon [Brachybacterium sp. EF45031]|uniref:F0F1 ATP synthase subunit epsilon n=1 Tax=Brachybacterium sillae TaxID=2810536 RepID=UPI00217E31C4|nr:F0F1 ATP synthase subunit epsilon [Brachybacterium sillae]MCS6710911.1 F0F1 ATP synthase subunit epsilon [Brachybacterium sillae]